MKNIINCFLLLTLFCFGKCNKEKKDVEGLPSATQEGKNTLGFLLNGQPWTPKGLVGATSNLSIDVDLTYNKGTFSLSAYRALSANQTEYFGIGIKDSLSLMSIPVTLDLNKKSLYGARFSNNTCSIDFFDQAAYRSGSLTISKLDKVNRIISGTFSAILHRQGCDTIRMTEGRFDMKY